MRAGELVRETARAFRRAKLHFGHGTANARDEATWLVAHVAGVFAGDLSLRQPVSPRQQKRVRAIAARRIRSRTPLAYLLKEAWLGEVSFYVDRRVIVPRSYISELLREGLKPWLRRPVLRALDLCTGSGCLAVLTALEFPHAVVDASDVSRAALEVARINVTRHRLTKRVRLVESDLFAALGGERYDLIVTNPPYVTARTMSSLPREYRHEPALALEGGRDGLDLVRRILDGAREHLTPHGLLVCEIGGNRRALERAYPALAFTWPDAADDSTCVFVLERQHLPAS